MRKTISFIIRSLFFLFGVYMVVNEGLFGLLFALPAFFAGSVNWQKANKETNGGGKFWKRMLWCFVFVVLLVIVLAVVFRAK